MGRESEKLSINPARQYLIRLRKIFLPIPIGIYYIGKAKVDFDEYYRQIITFEDEGFSIRIIHY